MSFSFSFLAGARRLALRGVGLVCVMGCPSGPAMAAEPVAQLSEVSITGQPLGASQGLAPSSSLGADALLLRGRSTLGEQLEGLPGVANSSFGPNAGRPVVRGLEGDRVRILSNGGAALDLSGLSQDHAVALDPLAAERVEVLRGPAALMYGGSAVGGVVNVIDNRIARTPQFGPEGGRLGRLQLRGASGSGESARSAVLEAGNDRLQWHLDAQGREAGDVPAPVALDCARGGVVVQRRRLCNSASQSEGAALGLSRLDADGHVGASVSRQHSRYGVVAEDDVSIAMQATRHALEGERRRLQGPVESLRWQLQHSDYAHAELEAGEVGSRFATRGTELQLQARHVPVGAWQGTLGLQWSGVRFSAASPDVAMMFSPPSQTEQSALFLHEERAWGQGLVSLGGRLESLRVSSPGVDGRFDPGARRFAPASLALGMQQLLPGGWAFTSHAAYTERAPRDAELFADGPHLATAAYVRGERSLGLERSFNLDLGLRWQAGAHRLAMNAYANRFGNFIALVPTGAQQTVGSQALDEFVYRQSPALIRGMELTGRRRLHSGGGTLDLDLRADALRAENLATGEPLPRMAPWRAGAALTWTQGRTAFSLGADHVGAQPRVPLSPSGERLGATSAYTLWHASASWRQTVRSTQLLWFARLDNLTDALAYSATSVLTTTAPGRAPLPGRMLRAGLQLSF